jgi:Flp pilus assembly pilin Flp
MAFDGSALGQEGAPAMKAIIDRLGRDSHAVTALEYGIIAGVLALVLILIFERFGTALMLAGEPIFNAL